MQRIALLLILTGAAAIGASPGMAIDAQPGSGTLHIEPAELRLSGNIDAAQLAVSIKNGDGHLIEQTREGKYETLDPEVAQVNAAGVVRPTGNGRGRIRVSRGDQRAELAVTVSGVQAKADVSFRLDVMPI